MINYEKFKNEIIELAEEDSGAAYLKSENRITSCASIKCSECYFWKRAEWNKYSVCTANFFEWLGEKYAEPSKNTGRWIKYLDFFVKCSKCGNV